MAGEQAISENPSWRWCREVVSLKVYRFGDFLSNALFYGVVARYPDSIRTLLTKVRQSMTRSVGSSSPWYLRRPLSTQRP